MREGRNNPLQCFVLLLGAASSRGQAGDEFSAWLEELVVLEGVQQEGKKHQREAQHLASSAQGLDTNPV